MLDFGFAAEVMLVPVAFLDKFKHARVGQGMVLSDLDTMRNQRLKTYPAPDYRPIHNRANGWGFNVDEQRSATFTGMGFDINIHDQWACESQGRIQDRTRENLGSTDKGIVLWIVSDNLRKGAALNAVQIAEQAIEMGVIAAGAARRRPSGAEA